MLQSLPRFRTLVAVSALALLATALAYAPPAAADGEQMFDISIYHGINGRSLGLDKELAVDIYVAPGGGEELPDMAAFTDVEFKDLLETELPAGTYSFFVTLAGETAVVMSLIDADIPAGADVFVKATLGAGGAPELRARVK